MTLGDAERGLLKGIGLIAFLKVVAVGWIGLDPDAWYVWPWSWLAFAWAWPWLSSLFRDDDHTETKTTTKTKTKSKGTLGRELALFAVAIIGAVFYALDAIINADKYQEY